MAKLGLEATWNLPRSRSGFAARPVDAAGPHRT
jgi:hypothetical protein